MRGQWIDYDGFSLIELVDEIKTRAIPPHNPDDILHGALIIGKDYYGVKTQLIEYLESDDRKFSHKDEYIAEFRKLRLYFETPVVRYRLIVYKNGNRTYILPSDGIRFKMYKIDTQDLFVDKLMCVNDRDGYPEIIFPNDMLSDIKNTNFTLTIYDINGNERFSTKLQNFKREFDRANRKEVYIKQT